MSRLLYVVVAAVLVGVVAVSVVSAQEPTQPPLPPTEPEPEPPPAEEPTPPPDLTESEPTPGHPPGPSPGAGSFRQFCEENAPGATFSVDRGTRMCTYENVGQTYGDIEPFPVITYIHTNGYRQDPGEQAPEWFEETAVIECVDTSGPDPSQGTPLPLEHPACQLA